MRGSKDKAKQRKPLIELELPLRARVYRAKFQAYEATRFLDEGALRRARRATLECGTLKAGGVTVPVVAEVERGKIVALKPVHCESCEPRKGRKLSKSKLRRVQRSIASQLEAGGFIEPLAPQPIRISRKLGLELPFDPHVIEIGNDGSICIVVIVGTSICWYCFRGPAECFDLGPL